MSKWILHFDHITLCSSLCLPIWPTLNPTCNRQSMGVYPAQFCTSALAPCCSNISAMRGLQLLQALCRGVWCFLPAVQGSAPAPSSIWTMRRYRPASAGLSAPPQAAFRGVSPSRFLADTSAPWDRKSFTCSSIPRRATTWRGVIFVSLVNTLASAPPVTSSSAHLKRVETQPYDLIIHWPPHQQTHLPYNF